MSANTPGRWSGRPMLAPLLCAPLLVALASCGTPGTNPTPAAPAPGGASPGSTSPAATVSPSASPRGTGTPSVEAPPAADDPTTRCAALVQRLTPEEQVGQLLMVAVSSTGVTAEQAAAVRGTHAGSVLLLGNTTAGRTSVRAVVADVRDTAVRPRRVRVLLAADQEGGLVQRLAGEGFSDIPSAQQQARLSATELARQAKTWGDELAEAGIDADLAPVADVVPEALSGVNEPIAGLRRGYGSSPAVVAEKVGAFTDGMGEAGIATAVKHFPGIGEVRGNTDFATRVVDTTTTRRDPALAGFRAAVAAGVDMVMVSSVIYTRIDKSRQAAFSETVVSGMIRQDLGFEGVVISDDLAAAAVRNLSPKRRAVDFIRAGGDLAIVGDPAEATAMARALVDEAASDPAFAARVAESAARVLALKDRRGLASC